MEALGIQLASKAQRSTIGRWFSKQKVEPRDLKKDLKKFQSDEGLREKSRQTAHKDETVQLVEERRLGETIIHDSPSVDDHRPEPPQNDCELMGPQAGEEVVMHELPPACFTETPARIVIGSDGIKPCPVLLLTFDLSNKIQEMIHFQRIVMKQKREAHAKLRAIADFKPTISREILDHKARIARIAEIDGDTHSSDAGEVRDSLRRLRGVLGNLEMLEEDVEAREAIIESSLVRRLDFLREHWADVNGYLEQAFVDSEAIEPAGDEDDVPAPILDLQEEYRSLVDQMQEFEGGSQPQSPLETDDFSMTDACQSPTVEQRTHIEASQGLTDARDGLRYAQEQFEHKQENYKRELRQNMEAELKGEPPMDLSVEDFDLRWVEQDRQITRKLLEAEEAVSRAKLVAQTVGLEMDSRTQSSCFPDDDADGSPEFTSHEPVIREHIARDPRMIAWQESLAESLDPELAVPSVVELDAWGTGQEIGMEDSPSCVAGGTLRKRIDKWHRIRPRPASIG